jgi:hypothetical protein
VRHDGLFEESQLSGGVQGHRCVNQGDRAHCDILRHLLQKTWAGAILFPGINSGPPQSGQLEGK